jgi:hypothetical protein
MDFVAVFFSASPATGDSEDFVKDEGRSKGGAGSGGGNYCVVA